MFHDNYSFCYAFIIYFYIFKIYKWMTNMRRFTFYTKMIITFETIKRKFIITLITIILNICIIYFYYKWKNDFYSWCKTSSKSNNTSGPFFEILSKYWYLFICKSPFSIRFLWNFMSIELFVLIVFSWLIIYYTK